ncbi:hypothetical protein KFE25_010357 [Diacronema lutheri]|uniref:DEK-C domain-containing protein n=1 Tax=Diacronema lutheri TaxID=2081491 RepID=A0A8J6C5D6_DIALT|nr:hypothetical protein KFE25_010357 [Diacronema lutheri]
MRTSPTDEELRSFVGAAVRDCDDLMTLSSRQIRHEAQVRWRVDLRPRVAQISAWALEAAATKSPAANVGTPAAREADSMPATSAAPVADAWRVQRVADTPPVLPPALLPSITALHALARAFPAVVHGVHDGEFEQADEALRYAARLCRTARMAQASADAGGAPSCQPAATPALAASLASLEARASDLSSALRTAVSSARAHEGEARRRKRAMPRRTHAPCSRTRAVGVLTRELLRQLRAEHGSALFDTRVGTGGANGGADSESGAQSLRESVAGRIFTRLCQRHGALLARLFGEPTSSERVAARIRALVSEEIAHLDLDGAVRGEGLEPRRRRIPPVSRARDSVSGPRI